MNIEINYCRNASRFSRRRAQLVFLQVPQSQIGCLKHKLIILISKKWYYRQDFILCLTDTLKLWTNFLESKTSRLRTESQRKMYSIKIIQLIERSY